MDARIFGKRRGIIATIVILFVIAVIAICAFALNDNKKINTTSEKTDLEEPFILTERVYHNIVEGSEDNIILSETIIGGTFPADEEGQYTNGYCLDKGGRSDDTYINSNSILECHDNARTYEEASLSKIIASGKSYRKY